MIALRVNRWTMLLPLMCIFPTVVWGLSSQQQLLLRQRQNIQSSRSFLLATMQASLEAVADIPVTNLSGESITLGTMLSVSNSDKHDFVFLSCLSHFGDFNAWEMTQQYQAASAIDAKVVLVGIGTVNAAQQFANDLDLMENNDGNIILLCDETGAITEALNCYRGWLAIDEQHAQRWPATDINPYIKLLGMIFGFGSPGTMSQVLYGYTGDASSDYATREWVVNALLQGSRKGRWPKLTEEAFANVPKDSGLRPFELATLRAQTGIHIVWNWKRLGPLNGSLFTRMGGTFVFDKDGSCIYEYYDQGILTYANVKEVCRVLERTESKGILL